MVHSIHIYIVRMWWQLRVFVVNALLHWRVPCYDSCFLSCFSVTQCFCFASLASCIFSIHGGTVGHRTLILLQGHLAGPGMPDPTLRPFMTHCPGSPSTENGLIGLGQYHRKPNVKVFLRSIAQSLLYGGYVWTVPWIASVRPSISRPLASRPRGGVVWSVLCIGAVPSCSRVFVCTLLLWCVFRSDSCFLSGFSATQCIYSFASLASCIL